MPFLLLAQVNKNNFDTTYYRKYIKRSSYVLPDTSTKILLSIERSLEYPKIGFQFKDFTKSEEIDTVATKPIIDITNKYPPNPFSPPPISRWFQVLLEGNISVLLCNFEGVMLSKVTVENLPKGKYHLSLKRGRLPQAGIYKIIYQFNKNVIEVVNHIVIF